MPAGRPTLYSEELASRICSRIATSSDGLKAICAEDKMPNPDTIYLWMMKHKEFSEKYARARQDQAQLLADEIVEISDEREYVSIPTKNGSYDAIDRGATERNRLRLDARKWVASKLLPKKYGDKPIQVGGIDGKPIEAAITVQFVKSQNGEDNS